MVRKRVDLARAPLGWKCRPAASLMPNGIRRRGTVLVCYELVQEFAELCRDFANDPDMKNDREKTAR